MFKRATSNWLVLFLRQSERGKNLNVCLAPTCTQTKQENSVKSMGFDGLWTISPALQSHSQLEWPGCDLIMFKTTLR